MEDGPLSGRAIVGAAVEINLPLIVWSSRSAGILRQTADSVVKGTSRERSKFRKSNPRWPPKTLGGHHGAGCTPKIKTGDDNVAAAAAPTTGAISKKKPLRFSPTWQIQRKQFPAGRNAAALPDPSPGIGPEAGLG